MLNPQAKKVINRTGALLDGFISRIISRKFLVWLTGTFMAFSSLLNGENGTNWIIISAIYIGSESVIDFVVRMKNGNNNSNLQDLEHTKFDEIPEPTIEKNAKS